MDGGKVAWKPPESVRMGPSHRMKSCRSPAAAMVSQPGRSMRWKVLLSSIWSQAAHRCHGAHRHEGGCLGSPTPAPKLQAAAPAARRSRLLTASSKGLECPYSFVLTVQKRREPTGFCPSLPGEAVSCEDREAKRRRVKPPVGFWAKPLSHLKLGMPDVD